MNYEHNNRSIKYYVKRYLVNHRSFFKGKKVIDFPAGNGITSKMLQDAGAIPIAMDLFPEYFKVEGIECIRANIRDGLPVSDKAVDALICQEGLEHFSDQFGALREFNRVLKDKGTLLITTPNYSKLQSKLSYLLSESERFNSTMPPNELDSIWMTKQELTTELYFGHIFLIGIQKLRVLAKLSGFRIKKYHFTRVKSASLFLFPFFYPFILVANWLVYKKNMKRNKTYSEELKKEVYGEVFKLAVNPKILIGRNLMVEFTKECDSKDVALNLQSQHKEFGIT